MEGQALVEQAVEPLVAVEVVAETYRLPVSWVYGAAIRGEIPSYKVGRYRRFRLSEIEARFQSKRT